MPTIVQPSERRFFLSNDNSGHSYVVPLEKRDEWYDFTVIDEDDMRSWEVPDFAVRVEGHFTFAEPIVDGELIE